MGKYAIGLDFGTNSCRALLVDLSDGRELANSVFAYPSGEAGVILDPADPNVARQNPADYLVGIEHTVRRVLAEIARRTSGILTARCSRHRRRHHRKQPDAG